jgi:hypothetical protein
MKTLSSSGANKLLNDPALVYPIIRYSSGNPYITQLDGSSDDDTNERIIAERGIIWLSYWFKESSPSSLRTVLPSTIRLRQPHEEMSDFHLLHLVPAPGTAKLFTGHETTSGIEFEVERGCLYFRNEHGDEMKYEVDPSSRVSVDFVERRLIFQ